MGDSVWGCPTKILLTRPHGNRFSQISHSCAGCRPPGKRGRAALRETAPTTPRSRVDVAVEIHPISSPKDIAGYRPNGPFNPCTSPPPTLAEILRVLLETRLEIKPRASHVAAGDVPARRAPCYQPSQREPGGSRALTDLELKRCARNGRTRWQEQGK